MENTEGAIGADPISACLICGGFAQDINTYISHLADVIRKFGDLTGWDILTLATDTVHNTGGHADHELSYILSMLVLYIHMLSRYNITPAEIMSKTRIKLALGNDQFKEIAKLRAIRLLWAKLCEVYQVGDIDLKIDAVTSWRYMSAVDVYTNMLRFSSQAFSAIIGGSDSINIFPFDLLIKEPDDFSLRQARNTAIILKEEARLEAVTDPSAGSGYIDNITIELAQKSWHAFQKIEADGGLLSVIRSGKWQSEINRNAQKQKSVFKQGQRKAVGVNCYQYESGKRNSAKVKTGIIGQELFETIIPSKMERVYEGIENG